MHDEKKTRKEHVIMFTVELTFNTHDTEFLTFRGNEDWWDPWAHLQRRQGKMNSDLSLDKRKLAPVSPCSSTPAFKYLWKAEGQWWGACVTCSGKVIDA